MIRRVFRLPQQGRSIPRDVDAEIRFHLESRVEDLVARGVNELEARSQAAREFGDMELARGELAAIDQRKAARDRHSLRWDAIRQDVRYALRGLRRDPLFTATVVLTLGLGIGANSTVFGIVDRLVFRAPAHVVDPEMVAKLHVTTVRSGGQPERHDAFSYPMYQAIRDGTPGVEGVAAAAYRQLSSGRGAEAIPITARLVSANYFGVLGIRPAAGRFFAEEEAAPPSGSAVAVLGWEFWQRRLGGDSTAVGQSIPIGPLSYMIVGIAPREMTAMDLRPVDVWLPLSAAGADGQLSNWHGNHNATWLRLFARMKPGVTREQLSGSAGLVAQRYMSDAVRWKLLNITAIPILGTRNYDGTRAAEARVALWLAGVAAVVLLIACANVANLLMARARRRGREITVRMALGISRWRLAQMFGLETLILASLGAGTALVMTLVSGGVLRRMLLSDLVWTGTPIDPRVLAVTASIAMLTAALVGLAPALQAGDGNLATSLRSGQRETGSRRSVGRTVLLVVQPALSVLLLVGAGLFVRSLARVRSLDLGYAPEHVVVATLDLQASGKAPAEAAALFQRARDGALRIPGVEDAAIGATIPFDSDEGTAVVIPGRADTVLMLGSQVPSFNTVTPTFFRTMGIRLVAGREFTEEDEDRGAPHVAVVNETMARIAWPGRSPIGACMRIANDPVCVTVIGVVRDSRRSTLIEAPAMQFYRPLSQGNLPYRALFLRAAGDPALLTGPVGRMMQSLENNLPYAKVYPFQSSIDPQVRGWVLASTMFGVFGALAALLAAIGVYSVLAYAVEERTREMGVRKALGATAGDVLALILSRGMRLAVLGVGIGSILALVLSRRIEPLLFQTSPRDPLVYLSVAGIILGAALLASVLPAIRAATTDPATAIRTD